MFQINGDLDIWGLKICNIIRLLDGWNEKKRQTLIMTTIFIIIMSAASTILLLQSIPPADCKVEDWSSWTKCSATCGGGTKTRGRGVVQEAENGGAVCPALEE